MNSLCISATAIAQSGSMSAEVASAINRVMHLAPADQNSLLDVIDDYFTLLLGKSESEDESSDESSSDEPVNQCEPELYGVCKKFKVNYYNC